MHPFATHRERGRRPGADPEQDLSLTLSLSLSLSLGTPETLLYENVVDQRLKESMVCQKARERRSASEFDPRVSVAS